MTSTLRKALSTVVVAGLLFGSTVAHAGLKGSGTGKVSFFATGSPGFLDIEGVTKTITVADDGTFLTFTVPLSTVSTGIDLRDDHMKNEFLLVGQFPDATLTVEKARITWPTEEGKKEKGKVDAKFKAHGLETPVKVDYTVQKTATGFSMSGKFNYDTNTLGLKIPSYLGVTVDNHMKAEASVDVIDAP